MLRINRHLLAEGMAYLGTSNYLLSRFIWSFCGSCPMLSQKNKTRRLPQGLQDLGRQRRRWNLVLLKAQQELKHFCLSKVSTQNVWSRANSNGMEDMHDVLAKKSCLMHLMHGLFGKHASKILNLRELWHKSKCAST